MTAQAGDGFVHNGKEYTIDPGILHIDTLGLSPEGVNSACWRGCVMWFRLDGNKLLLKDVFTNNGNRKDGPIPHINGIKPIIIKPEGLMEEYRHFRELKYKDVDLPLSYTGTILLKADFIEERYVHIGFQSPLSYETVIELTFEKGILKCEKDISCEMAEGRSRGER